MSAVSASNPIGTAINSALATRHRGASLMETHATASLPELADRLRVARRGRGVQRFGIRLGDLLLGHSLITPSELADAITVQRGTRKRLGAILVDRGLISAEVLRLVLSEQFGYPVVDLKRFPIQPEALHRLPAELCQRRGALPIALIDERLVVAIGDPSDSRMMKIVEFAAQAPVDFVAARTSVLQATIERFYGARDLEQVFAGAEAVPDQTEVAAEGVITLRELQDETQDQPVVRLLNHLLLEAIRRNASDIRFRPEDRGLEVSFRIDGQMVPVRTLGRSVMQPLLARIKVVGRMDLSNQFTPQDGGARVVDGDRHIDLRISVIPTVKGQSVTIRVLNSNLRVKTLDDLGFSTDDIGKIQEVLHRSSGLVLVTGPTGAGKSTTLYAAMREIVKRGITVMSVEDPVERQIAGVEQISINASQGLTFPRALRSILRHDPEAIMVGEIRDIETARLALESSLTGHLVLSTLHTNSAVAAIPRFLDMGLEPYVVASTLELVIAQRLIRLNCTHCLTSEVITDQVRRTLGLRERERFSRGIGCNHCGGTGYSGRQVVYEMLRMTDALRAATLARASSAELQRIAVEDGMRPLDRQSLELARTRRTSIAETYRVRLG